MSEEEIFFFMFGTLVKIINCWIEDHHDRQRQKHLFPDGSELQVVYLGLDLDSGSRLVAPHCTNSIESAEKLATEGNC